MEEIEYKLKTKNAILIVNAIAKLVEDIQAASESKPERTMELPELKVLKQKCEDPEPLISISACQGVVALVDMGVLELVPALSGFIAALTSTRTYSGIITSIGRLLIIDMKARLMKGEEYRCPFSLQSPQHPLVTLLKQNKVSWLDVFNEIKCICCHPDEMVSSNSIELLRPVFLYILCVPSQLPIGCRQKTWELILSLKLHPQMKDFLTEILSWLQTDSDQELETSVALFVEFSEVSLDKKDESLSLALAPSIASLIHHLVCFGHDPRPCLQLLLKLLKVGSDASSCVLMLLSETVSSCPAVYLKDIFVVCKFVLEQKSCNVMSTKMLECALLQWLVYPSCLIGDIVELADELLNMIHELTAWSSHTGRFFANKWFSKLHPIDSRVNFVAHLCKLSETWQSNPDEIYGWLERVTAAPKMLLDKLYLFLSALFYHNIERNEVREASFKLLLQMVEQENELASNLLTVIQYILSDDTEPEVQLQLLRGMTKMAVQKENITLILHSLEILKSCSDLKSLVIDLYVRLWKVQVRCYPFLEKLLLEEPSDKEEKWEFDIAKAYAIKQLCETRPELYSSELLSMLTKILNQCGDATGSVASSLALQGITALCKAGIVDITSTWKALAPKLNRDKRSLVVKSWCEFFGAVPELRCPSHDYEKMVVDVVLRLWNYVSSHEDIEVVKTAFDSFSKFSIDQLSLRSLPENYRQGLKLPTAYAKTPVDAARKPEDVLPYVPSECWIQMLQNINPEALEAAGKMLSHWLSIELAGFRLNPGRSEPASYSHLPPQCICRGLVQFLIKSGAVDQKEVVRECLRILSANYEKLLPPLNWGFLEEFLQIEDLQEHCIKLAAKQAGSSPSARNVIESFISNLEPSAEKKEEVVILFSNLTDLCKGVQPNILKPFVEKSLHKAFEMALDSESGVSATAFLQELLSQMKIALQKEDIHDANRTVLSIIAESLLERLDVDNPFFSIYVDCIVELPTKYLERMSSPSVWWEVTPDKLRLAVGIRSALARRADTETPLVWLNECIEATAGLPGEHTKVLKSIVSVMAACRENDTNCPWMLELMGQIQTVVNSKTGSDNQQVIIFLCDVFIITAVVMSGHDCFSGTLENIASSREMRLQLFPQALANLLSHENWKCISFQVIEWLFHMNKAPAITPLYATIFYQGLVSLRHNAHFKKSTVWLRFIDSRSVRT